MQRRHDTPLNPRMVRQLVREIMDRGDITKDDLFKHLDYTDLRIADLVQSNPSVVANRYNARCTSLQISTPRATRLSGLDIPQTNTLTNSFLKSALGCQEKLAKQYENICRKNCPEEIRQTSTAQTKKRYASGSRFHDNYANTKAQMIQRSPKPRPLIDNDHEQYLKTQLMFMEKPKTLNQSLTYHTKRLKNVSSKIQELGGIQDTVRNMEQSLKSNQMDELHKSKTYGFGMDKSLVSSFYIPKANSSSVVFDRINQSRQMRTSFQQAYRRFRN